MDARLSRLLADAQRQELAIPDVNDQPAVRAWCAETGPLDAVGLGRYLTAVWRERTDLTETYPGLLLDPAQREGFRAWLRAFGSDEASIPDDLLPEVSNAFDQEAIARPIQMSRGVTCVGYHRAVLGVGVAGRRIANLIERGGETVHRRAYDHTTSALTVDFATDDEGGRRAPDLDVALIAVNSSETLRATRSLGERALRDRYRIGFWAWELEDVSEAQRVGFDHVDEVWTFSTFVRDAFAKVAPPGCPVHAIPLGLDVAPTANTTNSTRSISRLPRSELGLPSSEFLVGFAFDYESSFERKNPLAAIEAYKSAVPEPNPARSSLVLKTINAHLQPERARQLHERTRARNDIVVIDRVYNDAEQASFMAHLGAYLSLHRSEGYGLGLLEAMTLGVPVIATAYSGNLDFMSSRNSWLVPYRLVATANAGQYGSSVWAEADTHAAARALRTVMDGGPSVRGRVREAQREAQRVNDGAPAATWIRIRLAEIRAARAQ